MHCHSLQSDGENKTEEMAAFAKRFPGAANANISAKPKLITIVFFLIGIRQLLF